MKTVAIEHSNPLQANVVKIEWNMGKRCNFNCSYCDEFTHDNKSSYMSFEVAKKTVDKIVDKLPGRKFKINLTGGEPTLNPEFEKILDYMYQKNIAVGITTNGSRTYDFYAKNLHKLASIIFSYHMEYHKRHALPENIVKLHKLSKTFDKHLHLHVHMMMLPTTFKEADETIEYLKTNGISVVMRRIRPARIKKHPDSVFDKNGLLISGPIAPPFYDGITTLLFKNDQAYYDDVEYYSEEELKYLESKGV